MGRDMAKMGFGRGNASDGMQDTVRLDRSAVAGGLSCLTLVLGAKVTTSRGDVAVEDILPGDELVTRGADSVQVLSSVARPLTREALIAAHRLTPVLVRAGGLGAGLPESDLRLYPWTQFCIPENAGRTATRRAMDLIGDGAVMRVFPDGVTYVAITLAAPAEVMVAGLWLTSERGDPAVVLQGPAPGRARDGWNRIGDTTPDWTRVGDVSAGGSPQGCGATRPVPCDCDCHKFHHVV
jgi:Hint domain